MKIAADFTQRIVVHSNELQWVASPMVGVDRRALDRVGAEVARATSIVRYAPGSHFSAHVHSGGEEFLVLDGVFQDEHGDFAKGSYIRNPPESKHTPGSKLGCTIFVKLWQFQPHDRTEVKLQTYTMDKTEHSVFKGVYVTPLYNDDYETVSLLHFNADTTMTISAKGGAELLVLNGQVSEQNDQLVEHSWLRTPINSKLNLIAGKAGATIWLKEGHLSDVDAQINRVMGSL
ncbi:cupin domain-containing protein [Pseudoalteromonas sp. MMG010]|uniref:cupin domain-containing protein n=1 Tax=Pseudoalteromonas sp. MMG010 TaxID=2822685 RepID=UPI001B3A7A3A|nr:cupin domain-containing protein [Pseudoalteromonas sp. MMG010]MBQ4833807.1 cupin domain-containing protein [Pseudoalteromonas sp. MMG010]